MGLGRAAIMATVVCASLLAGPVVAGRMAAGEAVEVGIDKNSFRPARLTVKPGTTIRWVNLEKRTSHSILFEKEGLEESERLMPEDSWTRRFEKPGIYEYTCGPHREMKGVVEVAP